MSQRRARSNDVDEETEESQRKCRRMTASTGQSGSHAIDEGALSVTGTDDDASEDVSYPSLSETALYACLQVNLPERLRHTMYVCRSETQSPRKVVRD